jgi:peptidoglycan/LPS O-acetylase OafA/YrhL
LAGASERRLYAAPDTTADAILTGCLLGLLYCSGLVERAVSTRVWRFTVVPLAAVVMLGLLFLVPNTDYRPLYGGLLPLASLAAAVLVAVAACDPRSRVTRWLSHRRLVAVGTISYGLYLWHPILLYGTGLWLPLPSVLAALAAARLSYIYVERPFLERRSAVPGEHDVGDVPRALPAPVTP